MTSQELAKLVDSTVSFDPLINKRGATKMSAKSSKSKNTAAPEKRRGRPRGDGRPPIERGHIIAAAKRVFGRTSISGASVREIADALGCHTASIFHHFPRKQDIVSAVAVDVFAQEIRHFDYLKAFGAGPAITLFRMIYDDVLYSGTASSPVRSIFLSAELRNGCVPELAELMEAYLEHLREMIRAGVAEGVFRDVSPETTAECMNALGLVGALSFVDADKDALHQLGLCSARTGVGSLLVTPKQLPRIEDAALALKPARPKREFAISNPALIGKPTSSNAE